VFKTIDGDVSIIFVFKNGVTFAEQVNDPLYAAHLEASEMTDVGLRAHFIADSPVSALGCIEQVSCLCIEMSPITFSSNLDL
jgi:hypothetical protein